MAEINPIAVHAKSGQTFVIRHGLESDAAHLIACAVGYIEDGDGQVMVPGEFNMNEASEQEWIKGMRQNHNDLLLLAESAGKIIGNIDFQTGKRQRTAHTGMFGMGIAKEWRSQGVGAALLGALISWAKSHSQIEKIGLKVLANNLRAIGLYQKFGFRQDGLGVKEIKMGPHEYVDTITMALFVK